MLSITTTPGKKMESPIKEKNNLYLTALRNGRVKPDERKKIFY